MPFTVRKFNSAHIKPPTSLKIFSWPSLFQEGAPLDLEIGCGVGFHPIHYAKTHPDRRLIAIEQTREKFASFERRHRSHSELTNLLPVHADAVAWVTYALKPGSIDRVFLLYPNPEPKASNKRWLRMPFFEKLLEALKPGGTLILATNIETYLDEAVEYGTKFWNLDVVQKRAFTEATKPFAHPRTHFEKKYLGRGETCFDVTFRKN